jgi:hypothetical protein
MNAVVDGLRFPLKIFSNPKTTFQAKKYISPQYIENSLQRSQWKTESHILIPISHQSEPPTLHSKHKMHGAKQGKKIQNIVKFF